MALVSSIALRSAFVIAGIVALASALPSEAPAQKRMKREPELIYVPTPQNIVDKMLEVAKVTKDDYVFDLGSGDGRIPITAAKRYGARGFGVEINPKLIAEARDNAKVAGVEEAAAAIARETGIEDYRVLYSTTEYKKIRLPYFVPEYDQWEALCAAAAEEPLS